MNLELSKATRNDIPEIIAIAEEHFYTFGNDGFLISRYTYDIVSNIMMNPNSIIYVTKLNNEVVSFLILSKIYHTNKMNNILVEEYNYTDPKDIEILTSYKHWHMEQGAVKKSMLNKGVGSFYYQKLFDLYPDHSFSSNVVEKPVRNTASINIKDKFGFRVAGFFERDEYKSLKNFRMIMFIKEAKNKSKNKK